MTAKKKKEKKVMEEKRPSLPEVVTVRKRPRTPGVTLNRLMEFKTVQYRSLCVLLNKEKLVLLGPDDGRVSELGGK